MKELKAETVLSENDAAKIRNLNSRQYKLLKRGLKRSTANSWEHISCDSFNSFND